MKQSKGPSSVFCPQETLLTRAEFDRKVKARSAGKCVFCSKEAVDAHHILERKLFEDGGYYLTNGAALCEAHHWECELTTRSVEEVRAAAGIVVFVLPRGFDASARYDKWGNRIWASGLRSWGPLEQDTGARRSMAMAGLLGQMMPASYVEA